MVAKRKITFINSRLYAHLFEYGGDELVSVYATLKYYKAGQIKYKAYKSKNGRKIKSYGLLAKKTTLSLHLLKKYLPVLIELGIVKLEDNGDVSLLGNNKIHKKFLNKKGVKHVPIEIGNYTETKLNSYYVRIYHNEQQQKHRIDRKDTQRYYLARLENNLWMPTNCFLKAISLKNNGVTSEILEQKIIEKTVLSNCGFAKLKAQEYDNPTKGAYWKRKLIVDGKIAAKRSLEKIKEGSYSEYLSYKYMDRSFLYDGKTIYKETASQFTTTPGELEKSNVRVKQEKKEIGKPLDYLSFDFIHWIQQ